MIQRHVFEIIMITFNMIQFDNFFFANFWMA